jgi:heavy metal translocating P-type ATPase
VTAVCCAPEFRFPWVRAIIGVVVAGQTMVLGLAINLTPPESETARLWLQGGMLVATLVVVALLGWPLLQASIAALRARRVAMELLFLLCVAGSLALSVQSFVTGHGPVYFEAVAILLVVYSAGRAVGERSRARALAAMQDLTDALAVARREDGTEVDVAALRTGDRVQVLAGELVPVDGRIVSGEALVRETPFTGEWISARRGPGDRVIAATQCEDGTLVVEADTATPRRVDALADLVERTLQSVSPLQQQADRFVRWFLPLVVLTALGAFFFWLPRQGAQDALFSALAVLLVACPCAAGLATPLVAWTAIGRLARRGLVVRDAEALERLASVRSVIFDKTGTLGEETLRIASVEAADDAALAILRAVERHSTHPVAVALRGLEVSATAPPVEVLHVRTLPGRGIAAHVRVAGGALEEVRVVRDDPAEESLQVRLERDGVPAATARLRERLRTSAARAVTMLGDELDLPVRIMTGDGTAGVARDLGPTQAGLAPEEKHDEVSRLGRPLYVGDGLNDAPALAAAHASIALASGSRVSVEASSATLHGGDLTLVPEALRIARHAVAVIRSNLHWAVLYNLIGITAAATGHLHPVLASLLMAGSSAFVAWRSFRVVDAPPRRAEEDIPVPARWRRIFGAAHVAGLLGQVAVVAAIANLGGWQVAVALGVGVLAAWALLRVWPHLPAWADMTLAMVTLGGLGMNLGWWADLGFAPSPSGAPCCGGGEEVLPSVGSWMNAGMLLLGVPAMFLVRHTWRRFRWGNWCCGGMVLLGIPGMVAGMIAGSVLAGELTATWSPVARVFVDYGAMLAGMCTGMALPHVLELALAVPATARGTSAASAHAT